MPWYEYSVGFYVDAESEEEALNIAAKVQQYANTIDPEGDAAMEFYGPFDDHRMKEVIKNVRSD